MRISVGQGGVEERKGRLFSKVTVGAKFASNSFIWYLGRRETYATT